MLALLTILFSCKEPYNNTSRAIPSDSAGGDTAPVDSGGGGGADTAIQDEGCQPEQALITSACGSCHGQTALGGLDLRSLDALSGTESKQVPGMLLLSPGDRDASYLWHKLKGTHSDVGGSGQPMPPSGTLPDEDLSLLGDWINDGASCAPQPEVETVYDPNDLDQGELFTCDGAPSSSQARIRRLDAEEWRSTIGAKAGSPAASNPLGAPSSARFSTYQADVGMDPSTLGLYLDVAHYAGGSWTDVYPEPAYARQHQPQTDRELRCMFRDAAPSDDCIETYLRTFLEGGAYFRPPTDAELDRLTVFAKDALTTEAREGWERQETLSHITTAAWLSVGALFVAELGEGSPDGDGRVRLTDWEHARLISNLISDRAAGSQGVFRWGLGPYGSYTEPVEGAMPDLQAAAADGSIRDPAVARALLRQYAAGVDPERADTFLDWGDNRRNLARAEEWTASRIDRVFQEWFDVEGFP
ncbi:MAG: c-type cytochrome domain-containing protein, partial [Myxococcota bacterium]